MPIHTVEGEENEPLFNGLDNPFWAVDSRDYQVIQPDEERFYELGASIICLEKERPHIDLERAIMAIRFNGEVFGTQFHPEADKKKMVIQNFGEEKFYSMLEHLEDPDKIMLTEAVVLPTFLEKAFQQKAVLVLD